MRIAICDDDRDEIIKIQHIIAEIHGNYQVDAYQSGKAMLEAAEKGENILSLSGRTDGEPVATGKVLASEAGKNILEGGFLDETTVGCTADPFPAAWLRRR